jgi:hypothetical protein
MLLDECSGVLSCLLVATALTACVTPPVTAGWSEAKTQHIVLRSNLGLEETREVATELQELRDVIAATAFQCAFSRSSPPVQVTLLHSDHYDALVGRESVGMFRSSELGWVGGYADQVLLRGGMSLSRSASVFRHELTHRLVAACFPLAPTWLNEGIASFFEGTELEGDSVRLGLPIYLASRHLDVPTLDYVDDRQVVVIPLERAPSVSGLRALDANTFYSGDPVYNYAGSWALVHLLEVGDPDLAPRFQRYLGALDGRHPDPEQVWQAEFAGIDLQARLPRYLGSLDGTHLEMDVSLPRRSAPQTRVLEVAEANLHLAWLWGLGDAQRSRALEHAERALGSKATRGSARALRALAYSVDSERARATAELDQALKEEPTHPGLLALRLAFEFDTATPNATAVAAQAWLERVESLCAALRPVARAPEELAALAGGETLLGQYQQGLAHVNRALGDAPACWRCRVIRAELFVRTERRQPAVSDLQIALNVIPHASTQLRADLTKRRDELLHAPRSAL